MNWEEVKFLIAEKLKAASAETETDTVEKPVIPAQPNLYTGNVADTPSDVNFTDAIKLLFTRGLDFNGRSRRKEYWYVVLFNMLLVGGLYLFALIVAFSGAGRDVVTGTSVMVPILTWIYYLVTLIPSLALSVRRLHDIDKSGWYLLVGLLPFVGAIILLIWMAEDSEPVENDYGPCPK